jgi:hypothetical protein
MIDPDLIRNNLMAQEGLKFLLESGVIELQQERLKERVLGGGNDDKDEVMLEQIRKYRTDHRNLESLRQLALEYKKEGE